MFPFDLLLKSLSAMFGFGEPQVDENAPSPSPSDTTTAMEPCDQPAQPQMQLPVELWSAVFGHLDAPARLRCARVNRQWRAIVKSPTVWKRFSALHVRLQRASHTKTYLEPLGFSGDMEKDGLVSEGPQTPESVGELRFGVFDPLQTDHSPVTMSEEQLGDLWPLLPPLTHLYFDNHLFHKSELSGQLEKFELIGVLLRGQSFTEIHIDWVFRADNLGRENVITEFGTLITELIMQSNGTLTTITGLPEPSVKVCDALSTCDRLVSFGVWEFKWYETSYAIEQFLASKRGQLRVVRYWSDLTDTDCMARLLNVFAEPSILHPEQRVHLKIGIVTARKLSDMFNTNSAQLRGPMPSITSIALDNYIWLRDEQMDTLLKGLFTVWCPHLRSLNLASMLPSRILGVHWTVKVTTCIFNERDNGETFDLRLSGRIGYSQDESVSALKEDIMQLNWSGVELKCIDMPDISDRRGCDSYKWQLTVMPVSTTRYQPGTRLNISGAH